MFRYFGFYDAPGATLFSVAKGVFAIFQCVFVVVTETRSPCSSGLPLRPGAGRGAGAAARAGGVRPTPATQGTRVQLKAGEKFARQ